MLRISAYQMGQMAFEFRTRTCAWHVKRIRCDFPQQTAEFSDERLSALVGDLLADADELRIFEADQRIRYLDLRFHLGELLQDPWTQDTLLQVLCNIECDCSTRLDFIYTHLLPHARISAGQQDTVRENSDASEE